MHLLILCASMRPVTKFSQPIERGMTISSNKIEEFMKAFVIGENVEMPPSGFSPDPTVARTFVYPESHKTGVLIKLHPMKDGTVNGMCLTEVELPDTFTDTMERHDFKQAIDDFKHEREIIRPSGAGNRCLNVTKLLAKGEDGSPYVTYIIDLEDTGYGDELLEATIPTQKKNSTFDTEMNTKIGGGKKPSGTKLSELLNAYVY